MGGVSTLLPSFQDNSLFGHALPLSQEVIDLPDERWLMTSSSRHAGRDLVAAVPSRHVSRHEGAPIQSRHPKIPSEHDTWGKYPWYASVRPLQNTNLESCVSKVVRVAGTQFFWPPGTLWTGETQSV